MPGALVVLRDVVTVLGSIVLCLACCTIAAEHEREGGLQPPGSPWALGGGK